MNINKVGALDSSEMSHLYSLQTLPSQTTTSIITIFIPKMRQPQNNEAASCSLLTTNTLSPQLCKLSVPDHQGLVSLSENRNQSTLLPLLNTRCIYTLYMALIMERRIILVSDSLDRCSAAVSFRVSG